MGLDRECYLDRVIINVSHSIRDFHAIIESKGLLWKLCQTGELIHQLTNAGVPEKPYKYVDP